VGVEKVRDQNVLLATIVAAVEFFLLRQLKGSVHSGCYRLAEEADQSLDVLGSRRQEELLPHKPYRNL
jgi:hypothetical protein